MFQWDGLQHLRVIGLIWFYFLWLIIEEQWKGGVIPNSFTGSHGVFDDKEGISLLLYLFSGGTYVEKDW